MALPTVDIASLGWLSSIAATLRTFFKWFSKGVHFVSSKLLAIVAANKIACTALFAVIVATLLYAASRLLSTLLRYAFTAVAPHVPSPNSDYVRGAFQLLDNVIPFDNLFDEAQFFLSLYSIYLVCTKTRLAFRWTVRAYSWICSSVK